MSSRASSLYSDLKFKKQRTNNWVATYNPEVSVEQTNGMKTRLRSGSATFKTKETEKEPWVNPQYNQWKRYVPLESVSAVTSTKKTTNQSVDVITDLSANKTIRKRVPFECIICLTRYTQNIPHGTNECSHKSCRNCIRRYFDTWAESKQKTYEKVPCPILECPGRFIAEDAMHSFYTPSEIKRWWTAVTVKIGYINKIYCPHPKCYAVMDCKSSLLEKCNMGVCYKCKRVFCVTCQKPWHLNNEKQKKVQELKERKETMNQARVNGWARCPKCKMIIEKIAGCSTIICTCGTTLCYRCGGFSDDHNCRNRCQNYNQDQLRAERSSMFEV